jgi:hypothetical protein
VRRLKPLDVIIIALALGLVALISFRAYVGGSGRPRVEVTGSGGAWTFALDARQTLSVPGPLGDTVVELKDGQVRVLSSPCPEKICVKAGSISRPGQWIACLPNRVFIAIQGRSKDSIDALSE